MVIGSSSHVTDDSTASIAMRLQTEAPDEIKKCEQDKNN